ncbi:MAG: HAD family phosphatase [Desulfobacteraceae bacterium]|nr:MAG: HAD family phosphatase [Desulfobacteraceae bacterium]
MIETVLFDFGGVLAREGFKEALEAIARRNGLEPSAFFETGRDLVYSTGYVIGKVSETDFWEALRKATGVQEHEDQLRQAVLERFILNPAMVETAEELKRRGLAIGILSDQTNWLDELDHRYQFLQRFDFVFNSFRLHKSKKDASLFREVAQTMGRVPEEILFVDDVLENAERAASQGLTAIHYKEFGQFREELEKALSKGSGAKP